MDRDRFEKKEGEKGMIVILMAIAIVGLIGAGSLAIDIGSALVTKSELQNVADAATLASTREIAVIYKTKYEANPDFDYKTYALSSAEKAQIQNKAIAYAAANKAGGLSISVSTGDADTMRWDVEKQTSTETSTGVNMMRITSRRDENSNGEVQTQLARVLGINQIAITADSAAAITPLGTLKTGKAEFPIGLDEDWFKAHNCASNEIVKFFPTVDGSCAGWHTFEEKPASAARLKQIAEDIRTNKFTSPEIKAGKTYFEFVGGTIASALAELKKLWNARSSAGHFRTILPIYESAGCENVQGPRLIVGFAKVDITSVQTAPTLEVEADVECGISDGDEYGENGGSGDYGMLVGTPDMIQ